MGPDNEGVVFYCEGLLWTRAFRKCVVWVWSENTPTNLLFLFSCIITNSCYLCCCVSDTWLTFKSWHTWEGSDLRSLSSWMLLHVLAWFQRCESTVGDSFQGNLRVWPSVSCLSWEFVFFFFVLSSCRARFSVQIMIPTLCFRDTNKVFGLEPVFSVYPPNKTDWGWNILIYWFLR